MTIYKTCRQCSTEKSIIEFDKHISTKDGYYHKCRACILLIKRNQIEISTDSIKFYSTREISEIQDKHARERKNQNKIKLKQRTKKRREIDSLFRLRQNIRSLIRSSIKNGGFSKRTKTYEILGCSFEEFKKYIESKFKLGMTWENYGTWEYDHITPVSWAINEDEIIKLNHYTNLQPLWREENIAKSNRFSG